jgi:hypothetical protein
MNHGLCCNFCSFVYFVAWSRRLTGTGDLGLQTGAQRIGAFYKQDTIDALGQRRAYNVSCLPAKQDMEFCIFTSGSQHNPFRATVFVSFHAVDPLCVPGAEWGPFFRDRSGAGAGAGAPPRTLLPCDHSSSPTSFFNFCFPGVASHQLPQGTKPTGQIKSHRAAIGRPSGCAEPTPARNWQPRRLRLVFDVTSKTKMRTLRPGISQSPVAAAFREAPDLRLRFSWHGASRHMAR